MSMRVPFAVLAAAGLLAAPHASAQVKPFVGAGLGFNTVANEITLEGPPDAKLPTGNSNFAFQIEGGVRVDAGNMVWGVGLYINPLTLNAGKFDSGGGVTLETEYKNLIGVFGELGWKLGSATVAYGRLSFNQAKAELSAFGESISKNFTGIGLGAGIRQTLADNSYLFVDWHHIMGSDTTVDLGVRIKPSITTGLVGVGWMF